MEIELKESNVEVIIKCTKDELEHFAKGLKHSTLHDDEDDDDCDCGENHCYLCKGYDNYNAIKHKIMTVTSVQPIMRKKPMKRRPA